MSWLGARAFHGSFGADSACGLTGAARTRSACLVAVSCALGGGLGCGGDVAPAVTIAGLSNCSEGFISPVLGTTRVVPGLLLGATNGVPSAPCIVIANASEETVFTERVDGAIECSTSGFVAIRPADSSPAEERAKALVCGRAIQATPVFSIGAGGRAHVPLQVVDREAFDAVQAWLAERPPSGDVFAPLPPIMDLRLQVDVSVEAEAGEVHLAAAFAIGLCPSCSNDASGGP